MSVGLIIAVGLIYLAVSLEQFWKGNMALGFMYFGYAFANIGAYMLVNYNVSD
jgi:hypothetical protein